MHSCGKKQEVAMLYIASPYSNNPHATYVRTSILAMDLSRLSVVVFSPVLHWHPVAEMHNLDLEFDIWSEQDLGMLDYALGLLVWKIPGWEKSIGLMREQRHATCPHLTLPNEYKRADLERVAGWYLGLKHQKEEQNNGS